MSISVIDRPDVFILGRQAVDHSEVDRFLQHVGAPQWSSDAPSPGEFLVETNSRLCYDSYCKPRPGGNAAHINHILEAAHGSVIEHCVFTLIITGISRRCCEQITRHRAGWSPSQRSQRYVNEKDVAFVLPPGYEPSYYAWELADRLRDAYSEMNSPLAAETIARAQAMYGPDVKPFDVYERARPFEVWLSGCERSLEEYSSLLEASEHLFADEPDRTMRRKRQMEAARSKLTNDAETRIGVTVNARALRWFLERRGENAADLEIRRLTVLLARRLQVEAPNIFADVSLFTDTDGRESVRVEHRKV